MAVFLIAPEALAMKLHGIFSDHMVLQRDVPVPVFGWAEPGQSLTVTLDGARVSTVADDAGTWRVELPALAAGGPHELTVTAGDKAVTVHDIMVGEVWLCSGQSNMQWPVKKSANTNKVISAADVPGMRMVKLPITPEQKPVEDVSAEWEICTPETVPHYSAVGYHFLRELHEELEVPVGMIQSALGGSPAEAWTPQATLAEYRELKPALQRYEYRMANMPKIIADYRKQLAIWEEQQKEVVSRLTHTDEGNSGFEQGWAAPGFNHAEWPTMKMPTYWEWQGLDIDGAVWFRREVVLPEAWQGRPLRLHLGALDDFDVTYVNGEQVGVTGKEQEKFWAFPRRYPVPPCDHSKLVVAVRIFDHKGNGGFADDPEELYLTLVDEPDERISLAGPWHYAVERALDPTDIKIPTKPFPPMGPDHPFNPARLFNGMIYPLCRIPVRGFAWYQGEANADRAYQYRTLLPAMIRAWRDCWGRGDLPFLIVQLANFMEPKEEPGTDPWPELRWAQALTAQQLPACRLACIIDAGEQNNIHPGDKQTVGHRLALQALEAVYEKDVTPSGPQYKRLDIQGDQAIIHFDYAEKGLMTDDGKAPGHFAVAGRDRIFYWADAKIVDDTVVLHAAGVPEPVAVRYGWANNPESANLYNGKGLPAVPFRTDDWPLQTYDNL